MKKFIMIAILIILVCVCYKLISMNYLRFSCIGKQEFDLSVYENDDCKFDSEIESENYKPDWCIISSIEDLKQNDLGVDLSNIDLSSVDFNQNNVLITFGCKLHRLKIYKPFKSIGEKVKYVDVYAKENEKSILYIYIIDKVEIRDNALSPKVIIQE